MALGILLLGPGGQRERLIENRDGGHGRHAGSTRQTRGNTAVNGSLGRLNRVFTSYPPTLSAAEHGSVLDLQRLVGLELDAAADDHVGPEGNVAVDDQPVGFT
jgi:hypothetical protein